MSAVICNYCGHPPGEHDRYGCAHWQTVSEWESGLCGCSIPRQRLLELEAEK